MTKISRGFSLIELAMVMAIIAILIVAVYSSYQKQVTKSRRSEAKTLLLKLSQEQEEYRADNNAYAGEVTKLSSCKQKDPCYSEQGFYSVTVQATSSTFQLEAVPVPDKAQATDQFCTKFTLNQSGQKYAESNGKENTAECW